jgi:hypothetical protein
LWSENKWWIWQASNMAQDQKLYKLVAYSDFVNNLQSKVPVLLASSPSTLKKIRTIRIDYCTSYEKKQLIK